MCWLETGSKAVHYVLNLKTLVQKTFSLYKHCNWEAITASCDDNNTFIQLRLANIALVIHMHKICSAQCTCYTEERTYCLCTGKVKTHLR